MPNKILLDKIKESDLTLLILDTSDVVKLQILKKANWAYVENINAINQPDDIDESLKQIREFYDNN